MAVPRFIYAHGGYVEIRILEILRLNAERIESVKVVYLINFDTNIHILAFYRNDARGRLGVEFVKVCKNDEFWYLKIHQILATFYKIDADLGVASTS